MMPLVPSLRQRRYRPFWDRVALLPVLVAFAQSCGGGDHGAVVARGGVTGSGGAASSGAGRRISDRPTDAGVSPSGGTFGAGGVPGAGGASPRDAGLPGVPSVIAITLTRPLGSHEFDVSLRVTDATGASVAGPAPVLSAAGATVTAVVGSGVGTYTAHVVPTALDVEVPLVASVGAVRATKIALPFSHVDDAFGQPEALDGLVNTGGWEDGANVSPDGQWLIVASYVPLDVFSCVFANLSPVSAGCTTIDGPYAAPDRPGMLGASRIHGSSFDNSCPDVGVTTPPRNFTFMPTAAYGFHRQPDGSFAEPFTIGFDADGCPAPYGHSFVRAPSGLSTAIVFAGRDLLDDQTSDDVYYAPLTLGQPNVLATYRVVSGAVQVSGSVTKLLPPQLPTRQGNPAYGGGRLYWDDEDLTDGARDLYYADLSGTLPNVTASPVKTVGVSLPDTEEIQPAPDGADLYFMSGGSIYRATLTANADPSLRASWSPRQLEIGPAAGATIIAVGEPTMAHLGAGAELYFVYIKKTNTGYDANVGRVPAR